MACTKQTARKSIGGMAPRKQLYGVSSPTPFAHDIWSVTEIVENILVQLLTRDLLLAQRVCSGWRRLIQVSPMLQEALFYKPCFLAPTKTAQGQQAFRTVNPLLAEIFSSWFASDSREWIGCEKQIQSMDDVLWATTPARLAFLRRDASWRRMLTAQPPFTRWEEAHVMSQRRASLRVGSINVSDGVRMGLVYDRTEHAFRDSSVYRFYVISDGDVPRPPPEAWRKMSDVQRSYYATEEEMAESERLFAGAGKLTLVVRARRDCCPSLQGRLDSQAVVSAGFEDLEVELKDALFGDPIAGDFTDDGFIKT